MSRRSGRFRKRAVPAERDTANGLPAGPPTGPIPDARDGLTRLERIILVELSRLERERGGSVPTAMLYGRVVEHVNVSVEEFQDVLARMVGSK